MFHQIFRFIFIFNSILIVTPLDPNDSKEKRDPIEALETEFYRITQNPYKNWIRPPNDGPVRVNISLHMNKDASIDEFRFEYTLELLMDMEWYDNRLKFSSFSRSKGQNNTRTIEGERHLARIWYPTIRVPNTRERGSTVMIGDSSVLLLRIRTDGYLFLRMRLVLNLYCHMNFKEYPFDSQQCFVKFESRSLSDEHLLLVWDESEPFRLVNDFQMTGFRLESYELMNGSVELYDNDKVSRIAVLFHLQREWGHYILDTYIPTALFVMISWISFWLEISASPARITCGVTTMLTLVTGSISAREKLPRVSYIHALDIWIVICICFVFSSLIEFAIVSYIYGAEKHEKIVKNIDRNRSSLSVTSLVSSLNDSKIPISAFLDVPYVQKNSKMKIPDLLELSTEKLAEELRRMNTPKVNIKVKNKKPKYSCLSFLRWKIESLQDFANSVDRKCRIMFPLAFLLFNIIYWASIL